MSRIESYEAASAEYLRRGMAWLAARLGPEPDSAPEFEPVVADLEAGDPLPAMTVLARRFELTRFEEQLLLLCVAAELDPPARRSRERAGDPAPPTLDLALERLEGGGWDALAPGRPLRSWELVHVGDPEQPLVSRPLRVDDRILFFAQGLRDLDPRVGAYLSPLDPMHATHVAQSHQPLLERLVLDLGGSSPGVRWNLAGADRSGKQALAFWASAANGLPLYRLSLDAMPVDRAEAARLCHLLERERMLFPFSLFVEAEDLDSTEAPERLGLLDRVLAGCGGVVFLATRSPYTRDHHRTRVADVPKPTSLEQRAAWSAGLECHEETAAAWTTEFNLGLPDIRAICADARAKGDGSVAARSRYAREACLWSCRSRLEGLAERLTPSVGWADLILPDAQHELLLEIADQVRCRSTVNDDFGLARTARRGLGITALFSGESGTGKTLAAEVIAGHVGLPLFRVDLSSVVSKYIGETEKNLRRLFDAADDGGAVLFFDEADALFGKRSEVRDSHDRYANIEVNYLLQRMESYRGLAILATNRRAALDSAFLRRLRFVVEFPFPAPGERQAIWGRAFPPGVPIELDLKRLARLNLTGGSISNVAVNAAFRAAASHGAVTMPLVLEAARREFHKLDRPFIEADLAPAGRA